MDDLKQKIKRIGVKLILFLCKGLILLKKMATPVFILFKKLGSFLFRLFLKLGGKKIILSIYKTYLFTKRTLNKLFLPAKNKLLYPLSNKEIIHFIIIALTVIICFENIKLKITHAKNTEELLGQNSILASLATEELGDSILIEEKVSSADNIGNYQKTEYSEIKAFGVKSSQTIGTSTLEIKKIAKTRVLASSEALLKPDITSTTDEPVPEDAPFERGEVVEYVVQSGDVIGAIAERFNISVNTILWANNLSFRSFIRPGDRLKILPVSGVLHKVAYGENLGSISGKYNVEVNKILEYNKLANADSISKGQELMIPDGIKRVQRTVVKSTPKSSAYSLKKILSPAKSSSSKFVWPSTARRITQYYHWKHHAIDIGAPTGTPIYSVVKGQVTFSNWSKGYGYNVIVDHGGGQKSRYAHFSKLYVKKGAFVDQGQQLGEMGSTGWSTGSHLHFELIINGVKVNPLKYIK